MSAPARRNNPARTLRMTEALLKGPCTYDQLAEQSDLGKVAVATWIKAMRKLGAVHICGWTDDVRGRKFTPIFGWGKKPDVPRAGQARTTAERMRAYRARLKAEASS